MSDNLARNDLAATGIGWSALPEAPETPAERRLRAVLPGTGAGMRRKPKLVYALISLGALGAIVVVQLILSVGLSHGAYQLDALQTQHREFGWQRQALSNDLASISSPQYIAANAEAIGMTLGGTPAYLTLSTGEVTGVPAPGGAVKQGPSSLIPNSAIAGEPLATKPDASVVNPGAAEVAIATGPVSLDGGLPSPTTR